MSRAALRRQSAETPSAVFGEKQLSDPTLAISLMKAYNRIAISFRAIPMALAAPLATQSVHVERGRRDYERV